MVRLQVAVIRRLLFCSRMDQLLGLSREGRFSYIVAVTDVLSRIINSTPTDFITQSLYYPQIIHIITDNIVPTIIHRCASSFFVPQLLVSSWRLEVEKEHNAVTSVPSCQLHRAQQKKKGIKPKMRERKVRNAVNWQGTLRKKA